MVEQVEVKENLLELIIFQLINPKYKLETVNTSTSVDNIILLSKVMMENNFKIQYGNSTFNL